MLEEWWRRFNRGPETPASAEKAGPSPVAAAILDQYVRETPSPQIALDLFKGEWWSRLPPPHEQLQAGEAQLFTDGRIEWGMRVLGGVSGKRVLELGPLEGGHTFMLERAGAESITAIEANGRAFLKCLIAKEVLGLRRARFQLGDFEAYLRSTEDRFDLAVASGVLYHVRNPVELISNLARVADAVLLWTHYYDSEKVAAIPHMANRFTRSETATFGGFSHTLHRQEYGEFLDTNRFAGGSSHYSHWLSRGDLEGALKHVGFHRIHWSEGDFGNANGPGVLLVASK